MIFFVFIVKSIEKENFWRLERGGGDVVPSVTKISVKCYLGPIL
jgi:hypothetical protein